MHTACLANYHRPPAAALPTYHYQATTNYQYQVLPAQQHHLPTNMVTTASTLITHNHQPAIIMVWRYLGA